MTRSRLRSVKPGWMFAGMALLMLVTLAAYVFTARAVRFEFEPQPDQFAISGGLLQFELGERFLLRSGSYELRAEKEGYQPLRAAFEVNKDANQTFGFTLEKLPGLVDFLSEPAATARVFLDDQQIGETPLRDIEVAPGAHTLRVRADRYRPYEAQLEVAGAGQRQQVLAVLEPAWTLLSVSTVPAGAQLRVDGEVRAATPAQLEVLEGKRTLELSLAGFKTVEMELDLVAGQAVSVPDVRLEKSDGRLVLDSEPRGANITVGGVYRGQTPLRLALPPGRTYAVQFSRAGYRNEARAVAVRSGEGRSIKVQLEPEIGVVKVSVTPRDSKVLVDGQLAGIGPQQLQLTAVPHQLRVERDGYAPFVREITPRPGFEQDLPVRLRTLEQARYDAIPERLVTAAGQALVLVRPGTFRMGASRREPGRRANEVMRNIELTRPYFIATIEVTNEQFKAFDASHESGIVGRSTLNLEKYPVVKVSWDAAARYCNWLSNKDGLPPAYVERDGEWVLAQPVGTGYRLPSEAEWVWAARGSSSDKYPWGASMPPPPGAGNFADDSARPLVARVIAGYNDGYAATAPVANFAANERGLYDFGGNVAEWVNDRYAVNPSPGGAMEKDPTGPAQGDYYVIRGSSWMHGTITELRWSFRDYGAEPRNDVGFRIARYAD